MFEKPVKGILYIEGMTCGHCQKRVEEALSGIRGVKKAVVSLEKGRADVDYLEVKTSLRALGEAVEAAGYTVTGTEQG